MLNKCYIYVKIKPENSMIKAEDVPLEFAYFFCLNHKSYGIAGYGHSLSCWRQIT